MQIGCWLLIASFQLAQSDLEGAGRQACYKYSGDCVLHPEWAGPRDDSNWAYTNQQVGKNRDRCQARAKEYFEW